MTQDMSSIEDRLLQLGLKLDEPFTPKGDPDDLCMALGRRARELHRGYVRFMRGGYLVASRTLLRPAIELNVLLRFIRQRPEHRTQLWNAEATRLSVQLVELVRKHGLIEQGTTALTLPSDDDLNSSRREIAQVRKAAISAGVPGVSANANGPLIPPLSKQVELIDTPQTWQAYVTAYLALNSEQHIGRFSFQQNARSELPDGMIVHVDEYEIRAGERELGSSIFASTLVIVSSWLDLEITDEADRIRAELVGL